MTDDEREDWAALAALRVGGRRENGVRLDRVDLAALVAHFGGAAELMRASPSALRDAGLPAGTAAEFERERDAARDEARRRLRRCREEGARAVALSEEEMPDLVRAIPDPPYLLYRRGPAGPALRAGRSVALVGARRASDYGKHMARWLGGALGARGLSVVSGAARGIDACAHRGALEAGGETAAVLGCGIDVVYPPEHRELLAEIERSGGVWSEFPPGTPPLPGNFPVRNRLISGFSRSVVVVEASERSGSLITARLAAEQGRDVLAVPSNATSRRGRGANLLIRDGARLVLGPEDVIEELPSDVRDALEAREETGAADDGASAPESIGPSTAPEAVVEAAPEALVLRALREDESLDLESLGSRTRLPAGKLLAALLELEVAGRVERVDGHRFLKRTRARAR